MNSLLVAMQISASLFAFAAAFQFHKYAGAVSHCRASMRDMGRHITEGLGEIHAFFRAADEAYRELRSMLLQPDDPSAPPDINGMDSDFPELKPHVLSRQIES